MRIIGASSSVSVLMRQATNVAHDEALSERQTALISIEPPRRSEQAWRSGPRPAAPFVAHLIATRMQAPQTRERRRAEPEEAIAVYRSMTKPVPQKRVIGARA